MEGKVKIARLSIILLLPWILSRPMLLKKTIPLFLLTILVFTTNHAIAQSWEEVKRFGGSSFENPDQMTRDNDGNFYGLERLEKTFGEAAKTHSKIQDIYDSLIEDLKLFKSGTSFLDDTTLLLLKRNFH